MKRIWQSSRFQGVLNQQVQMKQRDEQLQFLFLKSEIAIFEGQQQLIKQPDDHSQVFFLLAFRCVKSSHELKPEPSGLHLFWLPIV